MDPAALPPLFVLTGSTAAGKSDLALALAERAGAEVLSMDSMLVYRGMDVGTAKPSAADRARVPHHLLDLVAPSERYDVQRYLADHAVAERDVARRDVRALTVGGTGFYLQALVRGVAEGPPVDPALRERLMARAEAEGSAALHAELATRDPHTAERVHPNDKKRVVRGLEVLEQTGRPLSAWQRETDWTRGAGRPRRLVELACAAPRLGERIARRTQALLDAGWVEEVRAIQAAGGFGETAIQALGYREVLDLAQGRATRAETQERIVLRTRQLARRQRTWLRRFDELEVVDRDDPRALERVLAALGW